MPTEFFEREGTVSRDWMDAPEHELIYSTYQYSGPALKLDGFVDYLRDGRPEIAELERGASKELESLVSTAHYEGSIASRLFETPHGKARLVASYHELPGYDANFVQLITISDRVEAARYVHLLLHNITLMINNMDGFDEFSEDDTPKHIGLDIIQGMISWYQADMAEYGRRKQARLN